MEYYLSWNVLMCVLIILSFQYDGCLSCLEEERVGLLEFKASPAFFLQKNLFETWVDDKRSECCGWKLVKCSNTSGRVIQLSLGGVYEYHGGSGDARYLNASLFLPFQELQHLDLSRNNINSWHQNEGFERLSKLKKLEVLNLEANEVDNSILSSLGTLTSLKNLNLGSTRIGTGEPHDLTGGVDNFFKLRKLEILNLGWTGFSNNFLPYLGSLTSLKNLNLAANHLGSSGSNIAPALRKLSNLEVLQLTHCELQGFLFSHDVGNMRNLKVLNLRDNNFNGEIPSSILSWNYVEALSLGYSDLNGSITGLCEFKNLRKLDLSLNNFAGTIPPCFSKLTSLTILDLSHNKFSGSILPKSFNKVIRMDLSYNQFTGMIPHEIGGLTDIRSLNLSHNKLSGAIPKALSNLKQLESMDLSYNKLNGKIPSELTGLTFLKVFSVAYNNLSGMIPNKGQFSTFDKTSYQGNPFLCGQLLGKRCNKRS